MLLAAFQKWGPACATHLLGEFAFAIWNDRTRRLFCCRDHLATRPFYYVERGSRFLFASDPQFLLSLPGAERKLNRRKLAAMTHQLGHHQLPEETFFAGILSLPAGASLIFGETGVSMTRYWTPDEIHEIPTARTPKEDQERFDTLRVLLTESVENRLRGATSPAALLSGGLDSSAIVMLATRSLAKSNRSLLAISAIAPEEKNPAEAGGDRQYMQEFRDIPNLTTEFVSSPGRGPFDRLNDLNHTRRTFLYSSRYFMHESFHRAAVAHGAELVLDGVWGEIGPTAWGGGYYLELAKTLRWSTLYRELKGLQRTRGISPGRMLAHLLIKPLLPSAKARPIVLLNPAFKRECEVSVRNRRYATDHRHFQRSAIEEFTRRHATDRAQMTIGSLRFACPFVDKRVLEFCLAAPGDMKIRDGYQRYLIRRALDGILPPRIQWRTTKSPGSPDYNRRYNTQLPIARALVNDIRPNDPVRSIVDVEGLSKLLQPVDPKTQSLTALGVVPSTVYLICFLRQFAEFQA